MRQPGFDIRNHAFTRSVRGYDETEVQSALDAVAPAYDEAYSALGELEQALAEAMAEREQLLQGERSVIRLIRSAEEHARMRLGSAHREAGRLVDAAEEEASQRVAHAEEQRAVATAELAAIDERRVQILANVSRVVEAAIRPGAVRSFDWNDMTLPAPDPPSKGVVPYDAPSETPSLAWPGDEDLEEPSPPPDTAPVAGPADLEPFVTIVDDHDEELAPLEAITEWRPWRRLPALNIRRAAAAAGVVLSVAAIASPAVRNWGAPAPAVHTKTTVITPPPAAIPDRTDAATTVDPRPFRESAANAPLMLTMTSSRPCWVRVRVDGKAENLLLGPGAELERGAGTRIDLRIGDAGAATLTLNGRPLPPLGRDGEVVNRSFSLADLSR